MAPKKTTTIKKLKKPAHRKLHILVSNDDGIDAPGIHALVRELKKIGEVMVVAPDKQRSAVGHAITMNYPLRVTKFFKNERFFGYAVEGTPADCVKLAIRSLCEVKPDIIVSGVNLGSNTAINIIYSGTVSAATEGTILGIPSIAVSLTTFEHPDFSYAAKFARKLAAFIGKRGLPEATLLNVNVPAIEAKQIRGVKVTRQGKSRWDDKFELRLDPNNREYYWLAGKLHIIDTSADTDEIAVVNHYVSVTPLHYDLTDYEALKKIQQWKLEKLVKK
ncbi:MAG TPA: 5'/3'-nucleotidase SurE [Bacteroidota bacterium]|nr:5'/3'-nucleotidase SurE [Bacteroidota bacterium]